jgi:hypothetical protein
MGIVQLAMYAWMNFDDAVADMPDMPVAEAYERFIAWARRPPSTPGTGAL